MKGLLPDEEKEKIGPKNVAAGKGAKTAAIISAKPQANPNPVVSNFFSLNQVNLILN